MSESDYIDAVNAAITEFGWKPTIWLNAEVNDNQLEYEPTMGFECFDELKGMSLEDFQKRIDTISMVYGYTTEAKIVHKTDGPRIIAKAVLSPRPLSIEELSGLTAGMDDLTWG